MAFSPGVSARWLVLSCILIASIAACGDDDDGDDSSRASATPESPTGDSTGTAFPDDGFQFEITEVGLGDDGYVTLRNYTDVEGSLTRLFLCQPPSCLELPDVDVAPSDVAVIAAGSGAGIESVVMSNAELALDPPDGEIGLYASEQVEDPDQVRSYLQWGSTPHEGTEAAIEAGLWIEGAYAPTAPDATLLYRNDAGLWLFE